MPGAGRVIRGGGFDSIASGLRAAYRFYFYAPTSRDFVVGFRCARTP
jgi:formylglycine-generating enzyme required for sulfatase activity